MHWAVRRAKPKTPNLLGHLTPGTCSLCAMLLLPTRGSVCATDSECISRCEWTCNPGFVNKNGACVKCNVELDGRGQWAPEKYPDEPCTWVCEDGFFLLKKSEYRITLPVAIALGAVGGVIIGLLGTCEICERKVARLKSLLQRIGYSSLPPNLRRQK